MKKLMFSLALFSLVFTSAQAQKQLGGEHNIEVNLTPLGNSPIDGTTLKYRNFLDDDKAFRLSITVNSTNDSYAYFQANEGSEDLDDVFPQLMMESGTTVFGIAPGYEIHFSGTDNLSPYIGFEAGFLMRTRNDRIESYGPNDQDNAGQPNAYVIWDVTNKQTQTNIQLNLLFGADYYFNDAIYVGFEAGIGYRKTTFGNHAVSTSDLTAFNMEFNNAQISGDYGAALLDNYVGELVFDVLDAQQTGGSDNSFIGGVFVNYDDDALFPNHLSGSAFGNVFNASLRFGYIFD
tara:strand:+ start:133 stop:1005 length:873 start_codon:yes stop_codon:yes gene_type:complete